MTAFDLGPYSTDPSYGRAQTLDAADPLRSFADEFSPLDPGLIYLDGNSLGRLPRATSSRLAEVLDHEWGDRLIRSWSERWWDQADRLGDAVAELIGAKPREVLVADSTSVVLFKLTLGALHARPARSRIVTDALNFPTDNYITKAAADLSGCTVTTVASADGIHGPTEQLVAELDEDTALLTLSHVAFKSGYLYDMERLTAAAHDVGALVLWDLSHSVGAVPVHLNRCRADLAVGCTYKYLNGGPGSPAFLYVGDHVDTEITNPLTGWWGHAEPFDFDLQFEPARSIRRFQTGTMPILSLAALEPGVALARAAGLPRIREKSLALTAFFIDVAEQILAPLGFRLASPRDGKQRGSHVALQHPDGWRITQAIIEQANLIPDFRAPDNIRFGFSPLYSSFTEAHTAVGRIARVVRGKLHLDYPVAPTTVT
ncbi:MAG: kynureninase [Acidimicrobiia bacterium]|nr:kynureninase [Acidimicrobiia bacterium]